MSNLPLDCKKKKKSNSIVEIFYSTWIQWYENQAGKCQEPKTAQNKKFGIPVFKYFNVLMIRIKLDGVLLTIFVHIVYSNTRWLKRCNILQEIFFWNSCTGLYTYI